MSWLNPKIHISSKQILVPLAVILLPYAIFMSVTDGYSSFVTNQTRLQPVNASVFNQLHALLSWKKYLLLTFDDGPVGGGIDQTLVDTLDKHRAHAIFFINCIHLYDKSGDLSKEKVAAIRYMVQHGNLVENHTFSHPHLLKLPMSAVRKQITDCNVIITRVTGRKPYYFRPPFGATNAAINQLVESLGMRQVLWDANSYDFMVHKPKMIEHYSLFEVGNNSILDMHETYPTSEMLDSLLSKLQYRGYQFVLPVSDAKN